MENNFNHGHAPSDSESDTFNAHKQGRMFLKWMLDDNETDLKDEEPDCYVLGYNWLTALGVNLLFIWTNKLVADASATNFLSGASDLWLKTSGLRSLK